PAPPSIAEGVTVSPSTKWVPATNHPPPAPQSPPPTSNRIAKPVWPDHLPAIGWLAWDAWGSSNPWTKPERLRNRSTLTYQLRCSAGTIEITAGLRTVTWNGINLELGYSPRVMNGELCVHTLDLQKTLAPLTREFRLLAKPNRIVVIDP